MRYLGIDYGERRIGLAYGDELGLAVPLPAAVQAEFEDRMVYICRVVDERKIDALVIGYPYNMDGSAGFKAREVDAFVEKLSLQRALPVHRVDERLTSEVAKSRLGLTALKERESRASGKVDSAAAALILQDYLDCHFSGPMETPEEE